MMNNRHVTINGRIIPYTLKRRRYQRQINFIIHQDGSLVVTAPKTFSEQSVERSIVKNETWISDQIGDRLRLVTVDDKVVNHMKKLARPIIEAKLLQFNSYYNFTYDRVSIRHQKTRWGSCSSNRNLSFNCKLMCLSNDLRDYIVVHELCHLKEMNHSKRFWNLVAETVPNYKELRKELKNIRV